MGFFVMFETPAGALAVSKYGGHSDDDLVKSRSLFRAWRKRNRRRVKRVFDTYFSTGEWVGIHQTAAERRKKLRLR